MKFPTRLGRMALVIGAIGLLAMPADARVKRNIHQTPPDLTQGGEPA
jgi:hypothetical protein